MKYITFEDNTPCLMELARLTKGTFKVDYADKDNPTLSIPSSSPFKIPLGEKIMVDENGHVYFVYTIEELAADMKKGQTAIKNALNKSGLFVCSNCFLFNIL